MPIHQATGLATIAIDPGGTTGIAWRMPDGSYITAVAHDAEGVWESIWSSVASIEQIVYEQFGAVRISEHGLHTVRVIGGIQCLASHYHIPIDGRTPQSRYGFLDLAKAELDQQRGPRKYVVHEVDALAHLMCWDELGPLDRGKRTTTAARKYDRSKA